LVGSAIVKSLKGQGYNNLVYRTHKELELTDQRAVADLSLRKQKPEYVLFGCCESWGNYSQ